MRGHVVSPARPEVARLEAAARPAMPGCGARGRWLGLAETGSAPPDWRPLRGLRDPTAVPVGSGWAWPKRDQRRPIRGYCEACRARLRCPWAAAGPGRASRRRAERSSQRGRRAGGPPPTGTPSRPVPTGAPHGNPKSGGTSRKKWWSPGKPGDHHSCVHSRELTS